MAEADAKSAASVAEAETAAAKQQKEAARVYLNVQPPLRQAQLVVAAKRVTFHEAHDLADEALRV